MSAKLFIYAIIWTASILQFNQIQYLCYISKILFLECLTFKTKAISYVTRTIQIKIHKTRAPQRGLK